MSDRRDWDGEMNRFPIDDTTAERLLSGGLSPDDAPPGYARLAGMIQAATGPSIPAELASELLVVAAGVAALRSAPTIGPTIPRRKSMLANLLSAKVAAIAVAAVLGTTGVAAAATGNLPAGAQTTVSDAVAHVGISVPKANSHANANAFSHGQEGAAHGKSAVHKPADRGANAHADFGQCTAFLTAPNSNANNQATTSTTSGKDSSTAFADLIADHGGTVAATSTYCKAVIANHRNDTAEPADPNKPAGPNKPSGAGNSGSHAPVSTPSSGGTGTAYHEPGAPHPHR